MKITKRIAGDAGRESGLPSWADKLDDISREPQIKDLAMGDKLGYNAVEITAHLSPSPEHEYIQGRVFPREQFDRMQSRKDFWDVDGNHYDAISRAIGEAGCGHFAMSCPSDTKRVYSDADLERFIRLNHKGCIIDGNHYTIYEATRLMRKIEADVRELKTRAVEAIKTGDMDKRCYYQERINKSVRKYSEIAAIAGVGQRKNRMIVSGFKAVSVATERDRKANKADFRWIQENLPDICPKSLDAYRRMKNQNTKNYQKIVESARAKGREII